MFEKEDKQLKKEYKLVMNCCQGQGETIDKIEKCFSESVCVFCGGSTDFNKQTIKLKNKLCFCNSCYFNHLHSESDSVQSVWQLLEEIIDIQPHNCLYCEKQIKLTGDMQYYGILPYNSELCPGCYNRLRKTYDQVLGLLKTYKPKSIDQVSYACSSCLQDIQKCQIKVKNQYYSGSLKDMNLIEWKDGRRYCGICFYFKYEKIRKQFEDKKRNNSISSQDIQLFQIIKRCYQVHFNQRCMICSLGKTSQNSFHKLKQGTNQNKNKLTCEYCEKCLEYMKNDFKKFNKLIQIKDEIYKRESYVQLKETENTTRKVPEVSTGCLGGLFTKKSNAKQIKAKSPEPTGHIKAIQITNSHYTFPEFSEKQQKEQQFEQQASQNKHALRINKTKSPQTKRQITSRHDTKSENNQQTNIDQYIQLLTFESLADRRKRKQEQKKLMQIENNMQDNYSQGGFKQWISLDRVKQLALAYSQEPKLLIQGKPIKIVLKQQECKVFSCSKLTSVIRQNQGSMKSAGQKTIIMHQNLPNIKEKQNSLPLMMGLMCSRCFTEYLLGMITEDDIIKQNCQKIAKENKELDKLVGNLFQAKS